MATVLVIDDEFGIAELIEAILEDEGYRVTVATNGKRGLEMLFEEQADLVFLDYMMPVMDGAAVLRGMKACQELQGVPVVMMSSMPEATVAELCFGYTTFMRKPFRINEVTNLAQRLLGEKRAAES